MSTSQFYSGTQANCSAITVVIHRLCVCFTLTWLTHRSLRGIRSLLECMTNETHANSKLCQLKNVPSVNTSNDPTASNTCAIQWLLGNGHERREIREVQGCALMRSITSLAVASTPRSESLLRDGLAEWPFDALSPSSFIEGFYSVLCNLCDFIF